jgi:uncharacterized protein (DUF4415 family)
MDESGRDIEMREEYDFSDAIRGPVMPSEPGKTRITIRLDNDVLDWFRAKVHAQGGGNYQTLINQALRAYIVQQIGVTEAKLEKLLRRVIREELQSTSEGPHPTIGRLNRSVETRGAPSSDKTKAPPEL